MSADTFKQSVLIFGQASVGKSWLVANLGLYLGRHRFVNTIDCAKLNSLLQSSGSSSAGLQTIQHVENYLSMQYERTAAFGPSSVLVLDNIHALCAQYGKEEQAQKNINDIIKTEKFTSMVFKWIEEQAVQVIGVARHFSSVNQRLFEIGYMDQVLEMKTPVKEQRYALIKQVLTAENVRVQDIKVQKLAQLTEYYLCRDLFSLSSFICRVARM